MTLHGCLVPLSTRQRTAPRATHGCQRGSHFLAGANPIKRPVQSYVELRARDRFPTCQDDSIAIFNQGNLIKILHRANALRAAYRIFAARRFLDPENICIYTCIYIGDSARTYVAPATGMRKLSYSTSPRLTALVLCVPVDKHDRNNSEKKLSLTPGHVSALMAGIQSRQSASRDVSLNQVNVRRSRFYRNIIIIIITCKEKKNCISMNDLDRPYRAKNH